MQRQSNRRVCRCYVTHWMGMFGTTLLSAQSTSCWAQTKRFLLTTHPKLVYRQSSWSTLIVMTANGTCAVAKTVSRPRIGYLHHLPPLLLSCQKEHPLRPGRWTYISSTLFLDRIHKLWQEGLSAPDGAPFWEPSWGLSRVPCGGPG